MNRLDAEFFEVIGDGRKSPKMVAVGEVPWTGSILQLPEVDEKLVPPTRIERATRGLGNRCSIQLSYGGVWDAEKDP